MIQRPPRADPFKEQLRESLQRANLNSRAVKIARHANVYTCGDQDATVYFIESGQVKLLMLSPEGKECLLAIHGAGDTFGELCLSGLGYRLETATAMRATILKQMPSSQFLARLSRDSLLEGFVRYLALRIAAQQQVIANMVTVDSEQRLGKTLLQLARTMGKKFRAACASTPRSRMKSCRRWSARRGPGFPCLWRDFASTGCLRPAVNTVLWLTKRS